MSFLPFQCHPGGQLSVLGLMRSSPSSHVYSFPPSPILLVLRLDPLDAYLLSESSISATWHSIILSSPLHSQSPSPQAFSRCLVISLPLPHWLLPRLSTFPNLSTSLYFYLFHHSLPCWCPVSQSLYFSQSGHRPLFLFSLYII